MPINNKDAPKANLPKLWIIPAYYATVLFWVFSTGVEFKRHEQRFKFNSNFGYE